MEGILAVSSMSHFYHFYFFILLLFFYFFVLIYRKCDGAMLNSQKTEKVRFGTYSHFSFLKAANTPSGRNSMAFEDNLLSTHHSKSTETIN